LHRRSQPLVGVVSASMTLATLSYSAVLAIILTPGLVIIATLGKTLIKNKNRH
jgi:hypothetical protein